MYLTRTLAGMIRFAGAAEMRPSIVLEERRTACETVMVTIGISVLE
jgi:hypothetical protein